MNGKDIEELANELSGGYWNTRIIKQKNSFNEDYYAIHEVYYRADNSIWSWTENPITAEFETKEDFGEILRQMVEASERPILELVHDNLIETKEIWTERSK